MSKMSNSLASVDSQNIVEDLSGVCSTSDQNPYAAFINACDDNHTEIRNSYEAHRTKRNAQSRDRLLSPNYKELVIDQYLLRLQNPAIEPGFRDPRNCFVIWARPPDHILCLAARVQELLRQAAPDAWMMPARNMHMTVLEVAMCKTPQEIASTIAAIQPSLPAIVSHTFSHRCRLLRPQLSFDLSAFALSFVPASGESSVYPSLTAANVELDIESRDSYTYHHLRRCIYDKVRASGVEVGSRYQVPSAHITLGRFLSNKDHDTEQKRSNWVKAIDITNKWLMNECWSQHDASTEFIGEWIVGQQTGLDARSGTLWYGGGQTVELGKGFE